MSPRGSLLRDVQGKVRVMRLADHWTRADTLSASSYGDAPVWKATAPGLFRDALVRAKSAVHRRQTDLFFATGVGGHCPSDQEKPF